MLKIKINLLLLSLFCSGFLFSQVRFSSDFESGSLGEVKLIDSVWVRTTPTDSMLTLSYELFSRFDPLNPVDTSLEPSARWYYFRITGVKGKQLFINILNSETIRPFFSYDNKNFSRFEYVENLTSGQINKIFTQDTVYICHFIPYTCSHLDNKFEEWGKNSLVGTEILGYSQQGRSVKMMIITDNSVDNKLKKRVWIHGRTHPSEAPSSWHLEYLIDQLLDGSAYSKSILSHTIFYVVPFINPDGVFGGYSRSTSTGVNIEINWNRPDSLTMPEVKLLRTKITEITNDRPLDLLLNMHSQIANSVTYWIHTPESTSDQMYRKQLLLTNLTINDNPYFTSKDQSFSAVASKYVEGSMWNKFGNNTLAITFETPYTYYKNDIQGDWVSLENLNKLATNSLNAINDYLELDSPARVLADINVASYKNWNKVNDNSKVYFGADCFLAKKPRQKVKVHVTLPEGGTYKVYSWVCGPVARVSPPGTNYWKEVGKVTVSKGCRFKWKGRSEQLDGVADKMLFLK